MNATNCECKNYTKESLLSEIMSLDFAINDLALYLDTHPCCQKALYLHNEYSQKYESLTKIYKENFGPLTNLDSTESWNWIENPWPWERGAY